MTDFTITALCDRECGTDATWHGHANQQNGTEYEEVHCPRCDAGTWTWRAQVERWIGRRAA